MVPRYDLDLTKVQFQKTYGDITLYGTWFGKDRRPALVLMPTFRIGEVRVTPCVVPLATAFQWAPETGAPRHAARISRMFAESLGLSPHNPMTCMRITTIIRDHIGDLICMPPKPDDKVAVADIIRTDEHGRQHHSEVTENV
ncbi:hypothetical protein V5F77_04335 [Xanthobacter sp. DSM 24535]|uniref:hypothetical protein n=1 Tax=Roseixanthobacter psychrophilus TaxID=3119917 RepID=UPI00372B418A